MAGTHVAITHRIGTLQISDIAVVVAVSTPHRKAAYEANEYIMERIKQIVPIWKKEFWEDGDSWIGDQLEKRHIRRESREGAISMIRVLLFANLQEEAGRSELQIEKESITVAELKDVVAKEYNVPVTEPIMVAINEEYANEDDMIQSGDVVALIPPVSGG